MRGSSLGEALKLPQGIGPSRLPFQQLHLDEEFPLLTSGLRYYPIFRVESNNNAGCNPSRKSKSPALKDLNCAGSEPGAKNGWISPKSLPRLSWLRLCGPNRDCPHASRCSGVGDYGDVVSEGRLQFCEPTSL